VSHRVLIDLKFSDRDGADRNDDVGRNFRATRRDADRFLVRRLIEAVGLAPVRAEEGKQPLDSGVVIDLLDILEVIVEIIELSGDLPAGRSGWLV
jgi:hypothetical protein